MCTEASHHAKKFMEELRKHSLNKEEPIREWEVLYHYRGAEGASNLYFCICSKLIQNRFYIQNKFTKEILTIGSDCIERFNMDLRCEKCDEVMGGVYRRLRDKDFICNLCKKEARAAKRRLSYFTTLAKTDSGNRVRMSFREILENPTALDFLLNSLKDPRFFEFIRALEILGEVKVDWGVESY